MIREQHAESRSTYAGQIVHIGADNRQSRYDVVDLCRLLELGKNQKSEQKGADNVDRDSALVASNLGEFHCTFACILNDCVESLEGVDTLRKGFDVVVVF